MTKDIDSLAAELDVHAARIGNGRKELRKTWENPLSPVFSYCVCIHFYTVDWVAITLLDITTRLSALFCPLPRTLFATLVRSPLLHSLVIYTRSDMSWLALHEHSPPINIA
jgi:Ni/Fe-hydrogenase subunit HybB-like protein